MLMVAVMMSSCKNQSSEKEKSSVNLTNKNDSLYYSLGVSIGQSLKKDGIPKLNADKVSKGIADVMGKKPLEISLENAQMTLQNYMRKLQMEKRDTAKNAKAPEATSAPDSISYCFGVSIGSNLQERGMDSMNNTMISAGFGDVMAGNTLEISDSLADAIAQDHMKQLYMKQGMENKAKGETFLEANKSKDSVQTTASGLQYKILRKGTGPSPSDKDTVEVNYEGRLINGKIFDSSYKRGKPATFPVDRVIPGWTEALKMMKQGGEWMLYIPSNLAYGARGGGPIPPNSALIFKVELLKVKNK